MLAAYIDVDEPLSVRPTSILDRRGPFDIDTHHWAPAVVAFLASMVLLAWRTIGRPNYWKRLNLLSAIAAAFAAAWAAIFVILPWLIDVVPRGLTKAATTAPPAESFDKFDWLPGSAGTLPHLIAWPLLSLVSIGRFLASRKAAATKPTPARARNARALLRKIWSFARRVLIGLILAALLIATAVNILVVGAMNGPRADFPWISREILGHDFAKSFPADFVLWSLIALGLVLTYSWGESSSWSPAPVYKRRLAWAFAWARTSTKQATRREYGPGDDWADFAPHPGSNNPTTAGYLDGKVLDGTELVLCCAANIAGEDLAPTGRRAVSFTASRSFIGGPELGWMGTPAYIARMGRRRRWDLNVPGITALSGAAVSPAMGKSSVGPIGSILAVLNVRLGAWIPHPQWVEEMAPGTTWTHNPGTPWYGREVLRRFKHTAPYVYVTDGGHWENLGLVEALRRGCTHVVAISAAGDGELSHATFAEAVEIARTDLAVEIELDDIWTLRPIIGGETPPTLPKGRQYILDPGPTAELGRAAAKGYAFGALHFPDGTTGTLLMIEATMVDQLPVDVHAFAESHPEFPNVSTGDQLLSDRDFESYRVLGREITRAALDDVDRGTRFTHVVTQCRRTP